MILLISKRGWGDIYYLRHRERENKYETVVGTEYFIENVINDFRKTDIYDKRSLTSSCFVKYVYLDKVKITIAILNENKSFTSSLRLLLILNDAHRRLVLDFQLNWK